MNAPPTRKPDDYYYDADSLWGRESTRLLAACLADPANRQLRLDLAWAEKQRAESNAKQAAAHDRKCEREEASEWLSFAYGPEPHEVGFRGIS